MASPALSIGATGGIAPVRRGTSQLVERGAGARHRAEQCEQGHPTNRRTDISGIPRLHWLDWGLIDDRRRGSAMDRCWHARSFASIRSVVRARPQAAHTMELQHEQQVGELPDRPRLRGDPNAACQGGEVPGFGITESHPPESPVTDADSLWSRSDGRDPDGRGHDSYPICRRSGAALASRRGGGCSDGRHRTLLRQSTRIGARNDSTRGQAEATAPVERESLGPTAPAWIPLVVGELLLGKRFDRVAEGRPGRDTELGEGSMKVSADRPV